MSLMQYLKKRNFKKTTEPKGQVHKKNHFLFVVQKHAASHLHYDFRLELDGVLKSWAVPKGPSLDPKIKRLAIHVEDHPLEYGNFEGIIPKGQYGGGTVMLWDKGYWLPLDDDPYSAYKKGHLHFQLNAKKLKGKWSLIRLKKENEWLLMKHQDEEARGFKEYDITQEKPLSVLSQRSMEAITNKEKNTATKSMEAILTLAHKSPFPKEISVQLATLVDKPPMGREWFHEVKFDGYRILAEKNGKTVRFISRNQKDWSKEFHHLVLIIQQLPFEKLILDGEIVLLDQQGRSNFQLLQNAVKAQKNADFHYYLFDLLYFEGYDLRPLALYQRKALLEHVLQNSDSNQLHYSDHIVDKGDSVFSQACDFMLEGIVSKNANSLYEGKRTKTWLKVKCFKRQEFVVGGFSTPKNTRAFFGSLFLGFYNQHKELVYAGNVGTGFTTASLENIFHQLKSLIQKENPFNSCPPGSKSAFWVKPKLVVEVEFSQWTKDNRLRHPSFKGLRSDKKPKEVIREEVASIKPTSLQLTHPKKVLYKEDRITKQERYDYYQTVSNWMLPFIINRPLTLLRCPSKDTPCFFQKHLNQSVPSLHSIPILNKKNESEHYFYIYDEQGLLRLVQMDALEIHPWSSTIVSLKNPDFIVFDLDPAPELPWEILVEAAFEIKEELKKQQLISFVKTTGGKGLHVVIPIMPQYDWDLIKQFTYVFALYLEKRSPEKYTAKMTKSRRAGKIYLDYLRNQQGATAIAPYSTRAHPYAPVAVPLRWEELSAKKEDNSFTIKTVPARLKKLKEDPWEGFWQLKQSLPL